MESGRQSTESYGQPGENPPSTSYGQQGQEARPAAATYTAPTPGPDYSERAGTFNSYVQPRNNYHSGHHSTPPSNMGSNSPSPPQPDVQPHDSSTRSDSCVPIDPSMASQTASPSTYTPAPQPQHPYGYEGMHNPPGHYGQMYPRWHEQPHGYPIYASAAPAAPITSPTLRPPTGGLPMQQVYSFVPIPGAQQHKRPRRRYEEIERMYKCGWMGCEKAYGTLNHLNAHVTMQSHGAKRTPEEFKEIRKEWKAKKKEEEAQRKAAEEAAQRNGEAHHPSTTDGNGVYGAVRPAVAGMTAPPPAHPQLPPLGYQPANNANAVSGQYTPQAQGSMDPNQNSGYPPSPYGQNPYNPQGPH